MALVTLTLPKCDSCGEVTLPGSDAVHKGIRARDNIRAYDSARRADGLPPYRCGKCKSPGWDREFVGDRRRRKLRIPSEAEKAENISPLLHGSGKAQSGSGLEALYGIFEEEFKALGGGEAFLRAEREAWGPDPWEKLAMEREAESRKAG